MVEKPDFERAWLTKLSRCLDEVAGEEIRRQVMEGSEVPSPESGSQEVIDWTKKAMERLESLVDEDERKQIMTGCACRYPKSALREVKKTYQETRDIDLVHRMLQQQFESFLTDALGLDDELREEIIRRGWGLAGVKKEHTIIATKIPKSGNLVAYVQETDPERKRQEYCHCPRVRNAAKIPNTIPTTYCYCGAGYYKGIWEEILQQPVDVKVLESVLKGDEVCKIAIHLPERAIRKSSNSVEGFENSNPIATA